MCINTNNRVFYVYTYLDPRKPGNYIYGDYKFDYEPFYVGKGSNSRSNCHLNKNKDNSHFDRKIKKIQRECCSDPIIIKYKEQLLENEAFDFEKHMIQTIGRDDKKQGPLCNKTNGGDGASGCIRNTETRQRMSQSKIGIKRPDNVKRKISESHTGKSISDETKKKMSESNKGKTPWNKGKTGYNISKPTEETKRKISETKKGKPPWNKGKRLKKSS